MKEQTLTQTTRLILARHGNTFRPDDTPVWVGARTDLPLVEKGLIQAQALADRLRETHTIPDAIIAGPLQRTKKTAEIVAATLALPADQIRIDARLMEIDYGKWEGKSTPEIIAMGDGDKLKAWDKNSIFPVDVGWTPSETQIITNVAALLSESSHHKRNGIPPPLWGRLGGGLRPKAQTSHPTTLIITSNGIMRFFARAALNAADFPDRKVATGHVCVMEHSEADWNIVQWNQPPALLAMKGLG